LINNSEDKFLIVKGCAGLGNRLFTILESLNYALRNNRKLYIDWSDGQFGKLNHNIFNEFFYLRHNLFIDDLANYPNYDNDCYPKLWNRNLDKNIYDLYDVGTPNYLLKKTPNFFISIKNIRNKNQLWVKKNVNIKYGLKDLYDCENMVFGGDLVNNLKYRTVIFADFKTKTYNYDLVPVIKLKSFYENEINKWSDHYKISDYLGIHIRSSDKKPTVSVSSFLRFLKKNLPNKKIFLSTDNSNIEFLFRENFKGNLLTFKKDIPSEVSGRGIHMWGLDNNDDNYKEKILKESIYDMWLLSKCKTLFFQGNSSFSQFSKILHSTPQDCYDWQKMIK
tara:strand:- start:151 stop:1155 length:1005 start_codon:yes stop_codon:yes gene_type:complete